MQRKNRQSGNVLFIILIGVALFAALSLAVSNMMRGGGSGVGDEQTQLVASEILGYGRIMRQAVQDIRISNGCEDEDISFETSFLSGYEHSTAAPDMCKIFHPGGGGLSYPKPAMEWFDSAHAGAALYGEWYLSGNERVVNLGDAAAPELVVFLPWVSSALCSKINESLGITLDDKEQAAFSADHKFTGEYSADGLVIGTNTAALQGKTVGCLKDARGDFFFYQVLISR